MPFCSRQAVSLCQYVSLSAVLLWQLHGTGNNKTQLCVCLKRWYFCMLFTKFGFSQRIFIKVPDVRFLKKSVLWELNGYMQVDRWTDVMKLTGAVHEYADVNKNSGDSINMWAVRGAVYGRGLLYIRARRPHLGIRDTARVNLKGLNSCSRPEWAACTHHGLTHLRTHAHTHAHTHTHTHILRITAQFNSTNLQTNSNGVR